MAKMYIVFSTTYTRPTIPETEDVDELETEDEYDTLENVFGELNRRREERDALKKEAAEFDFVKHVQFRDGVPEDHDKIAAAEHLVVDLRRVVDLRFSMIGLEIRMKNYTIDISWLSLRQVRFRGHVSKWIKRLFFHYMHQTHLEHFVMSYDSNDLTNRITKLVLPDHDEETEESNPLERNLGGVN